MARILSDDLPRPRVPVLTYALMGAWVALWIIQALRPDDGNVVDSSQALACRWGMVPAHLPGQGGAAAADPCVVLSAEHSPWVGALTAQFLHASWWHLLGSLLFLWVFAPSVEERLGRARFLLFAIGVGYLAFMAEARFDATSVQPVIGGSGIVAAVLGAYIVLFPEARLHLALTGGRRGGGIPAWVPIALWVAWETAAAISGAQADTAHWVHVVGFALGALLAIPAGAGRSGAARPDAQWVRVAIARNQPEAEMIQGMLGDAGIPAYVRRMAGFDVPDYLAGGPRDIMVPGDRAIEAHALIDPLDAGDDAPADG
ncbi:MAG: rhomboid family intramembrane serine protease [Actinobacteria bacterium]|nr:rhomboid family intramembrane serine protease [Actinomycetota bacterium]